MTNTTVEPDEATRLRNKVVDELRADGTISSPEIEAAMRKVPRHEFTPGTPLHKAYETYAAVVTKTDEHGVQLSSVSAPQIQAMMLEQAMVKPGMRVLEIGSGGLNAAYLAELVGPEGEVVTADIDPAVTERASQLLEEHGYEKVLVVTADAAEPLPVSEVDVVMVTAGAWDISPAWITQLKPGGRLVVPLRMRGLTRSIAFTQVTGEHGAQLESESALICGFVPMQGATAHQEELLLVNGTPEIGLKFDDGLPAAPHRLDNAVTTPRHEMWTGVTVGLQELLDTLQMTMAIDLSGFCTMAVDPDLDTGLVAPTNKRFALAAVEDDSFAYLVTRRTEDDKHVEYGVHALGPHAKQLADKVTGVLRGWESTRRGGSSPVIRVYPADTPDDQIQADRVIDKAHTRISLSWPPA